MKFIKKLEANSHYYSKISRESPSFYICTRNNDLFAHVTPMTWNLYVFYNLGHNLLNSLYND